MKTLISILFYLIVASTFGHAADFARENSITFEQTLDTNNLQLGLLPSIKLANVSFSVMNQQNPDTEVATRNIVVVLKELIAQRDQNREIKVSFRRFTTHPLVFCHIAWYPTNPGAAVQQLQWSRKEPDVIHFNATFCFEGDRLKVHAMPDDMAIIKQLGIIAEDLPLDFLDVTAVLESGQNQ